MNLSSYYATIDGEKDLSSSILSNYIVNPSQSLFRVRDRHIGRPDLISLDMYGVDEYWEIVLRANNIQDPFTDIFVDMILLKPDMSEITRLKNSLLN